MHSYPWRDVFFFPWEEAYVLLSDPDGGVNITDNMCECVFQGYDSFEILFSFAFFFISVQC